jgi:hypothetical protein
MTDRAYVSRGVRETCACGRGQCRIADLRAEFAARRNCGCTPVRVGERVVVQSTQGGQIEALVMGRTRKGEVLIRTSRWGVTVATPMENVIRRLDLPAAGEPEVA